MKHLFTMLLLAVLCLAGSMEVKAAYYVTGDGWCGDNWSAAGTVMAENDGIWSVTIENVAAGDHQFKVTDGTWGNSWGNGGDNYSFTLSSASDVTVYFDSDSKGVLAVYDGFRYLMKNNWNEGDAWTWKEMTRNGYLYELTSIFGATGVNINTAEDDENAKWFPMGSITGDPFTAGMEVKFTYNPLKETLSATVIDNKGLEIAYYIKHNWAGSNWSWQKMTQEDDVFTYTGEYGNTGANINTQADDSGSIWIETPSIIGSINVGNRAKFIYNSKEQSLSIVQIATVEIGQHGYATYVTPCALDFTESGVTAYAVTPDLANNVVTLTPQTQVPAGMAIVVKANQGSYDIPAIASAEDFDTALEVSATATAYDTNYTYYYLGVDNGTVGFRPLAEGGSIAAGKCFFKVAKTPGAKFLTMSFDDEVSGISTVTTNVENNAAYNLAGQRINANQKGIVIINGKKYINK